MKGSESDNAAGVGASVRPVLDDVLAGLRGAGPLSSEDVRRQNGFAMIHGVKSMKGSRRGRSCIKGI